MDWTDEQIIRLRVLWAQTPQLSTIAIGNSMGMSKNAVVGKAHRLDLTARPSPIRAAGSGRGARRHSGRHVLGTGAITGSTLPPLFTGELPPPIIPMVRPPPKREPEVARFSRKPIPCCFPLGEPGTRKFRFCDAEGRVGSPYCETHHAVCYVKNREPREFVPHSVLEPRT